MIPRPDTSPAFVEYFRCPPQFGSIGVAGPLSAEKGYFSYQGAVCYGRCSAGRPSAHLNGDLRDASSSVTAADGPVLLPFDFDEVVNNLRFERYAAGQGGQSGRLTGASATRRLYYMVRPLLPVALRKRLQRVRLNDWKRIVFPQWPVDFTIETLMKAALRLQLRKLGVDRIPFIWFWPEGVDSAAIVTHDVEARVGSDFCARLMDIDDSYGIKSSFQIVPEGRYSGSERLAADVAARGFEAAIHDLNHDGHLFDSHRTFLARVARINEYGRRFHSEGFRSAVMYRNQDWLRALQFAYDMSVPNVAHLDPQRGGCCGVMPYFIGDVVELPLTTIQDYSLFHILNDYSGAIWHDQIVRIRSQNGLVSVITHPDYLVEARAQAAYQNLLGHLRDLRTKGGLWIALPRDVARWWRARSRMALINDGNSWRIEGPDASRARVAYATLSAGRVVYELERSS